MLYTEKFSNAYPDLFVCKYKNKVFYDDLWDERLVEMRGHVYDKDGTRVINPFTKIFNRNERGTDIPLGDWVIAIQKINGFMAAATYVERYDEVIISTTGSLDSPYVKLAKQFITPKMRETIREYYKGYTLLFEIVHPVDPHIIEEVPGAWLIGAREVRNDAPYHIDYNDLHTLLNMSLNLECMFPKWWMLRLDKQFFIDFKSRKDEGMVLYQQHRKNNVVMKLKTPYYLAAKAMARIKDIERLNKSRVDEEFYPLIDHFKNTGFSGLDEQERLKKIREYYA